MNIPFNEERETVKASLRKNSMKKIGVTGQKEVDDITYYQVDASNGVINWTMLVRYDKFSVLHDEMIKVWELRMSFQYRLPPFPEKASKLVTDHKDPHFIRERRVLLDNYLKRLATSKIWKTARAFLAFILPGDHCLEAWVERLALPDEPADGEEKKKEEKKKNKSKFLKHAVVDSDEEYSESHESDDGTAAEFTHVRVPSAQVLRGDHVIYQVDVRNGAKRSQFSNWVVLKRYQEFFDLDTALMAIVEAKYPHVKPQMPPIPPRESKVFVNHLDHSFIERRRVLLESYLQTLITVPEVKTQPALLAFLGAFS